MNNNDNSNSSSQVSAETSSGLYVSANPHSRIFSSVGSYSSEPLLVSSLQILNYSPLESLYSMQQGFPIPKPLRPSVVAGNLSYQNVATEEVSSRTEAVSPAPNLLHPPVTVGDVQNFSPFELLPLPAGTFLAEVTFPAPQASADLVISASPRPPHDNSHKAQAGLTIGLSLPENGPPVVSANDAAQSISSTSADLVISATSVNSHSNDITAQAVPLMRFLLPESIPPALSANETEQSISSASSNIVISSVVISSEVMTSPRPNDNSQIANDITAQKTSPQTSQASADIVEVIQASQRPPEIQQPQPEESREIKENQSLKKTPSTSPSLVHAIAKGENGNFFTAKPIGSTLELRSKDKDKWFFKEQDHQEKFRWKSTKIKDYSALNKNILDQFVDIIVIQYVLENPDKSFKEAEKELGSSLNYADRPWKKVNPSIFNEFFTSASKQEIDKKCKDDATISSLEASGSKSLLRPYEALGLESSSDKTIKEFFKEKVNEIKGLIETNPEQVEAKVCQLQEFKDFLRSTKEQQEKAIESSEKKTTYCKIKCLTFSR